MGHLLTRAVDTYREEGASRLAYKSKKYIKNTILNIDQSDRLSYEVSKYKLRKLMREEDCLDDILNTAYTFRGHGPYQFIKPLQIREEWYAFLTRIEAIEPSVLVEIGTAHGGSLYTFCRYFEQVDTIISIDLPDGPHGGGYPKEKEKFFQFFSGDCNLFCIRGDSHDASIKEDVENILHGREIDFLFIDGDHTYEGVKQDFKMYSPLVRKGGIIGFDDLFTHQRENFDASNHGVGRYWNQLKKEHDDTEEIISEDESTRDKGLGIIRKRAADAEG